MVMLGGTQGSTHHAVVPPHCAESSSVASLPCGHTRERKKRDRREGSKEGRKEERKKEMRVGWRESRSNSGRFGMDRGHAPVILQPP